MDFILDLNNMRTINLVNKVDGDDYILTIYSDNQIDLIIPNVSPGAEYQIISRCSNYNDLITIVSANQILKDAGVKYIELVCPYILGGRSDAKFKTNQSFGLKIVTNIINSCNFNKVITLSPHSAVTPALINNCSSVDTFSWFPIPLMPKHAVLISPDAGAYKKMVRFADMCNRVLIPANKVRNAEGAPEIKFDGSVKDKDCFIIDDICDGGRTFIALGKALKDNGAATVSLVVDHGIFAYGYKLENIDKIFTTNSYRDFEDLDTIDPNYLNIYNIF